MNICLFLTNVYVLYGDILHIVCYYYFFLKTEKCGILVNLVQFILQFA